MSQIVFKKISITNFLSIGPTVEFDFSTHSGLNYVFGTDRDIPGVKNGIGKSLIFVDAILYILYGKTSKDISKKYLFNRQTPKTENMDLSLVLLINNKEYKIEAGINKPTTSCSSYFRIYEDGKELPSKSSTDDTRDYFVKDILKVNYNIMKNSIILTSCDTQNFFSMNKSQKREFIENIFNLKKFGDILKIVRSDINSLSKDILSIQTTNKQLNEDISKFNNLNNNFEIDKVNSINEITNNITKYEQNYTNIQEQINLLNAQKETIKIIDDKVLIEKNNILNKQINELEKKIKDNEHEIDKINTIINANSNVINNVCNNCSEKINSILDIKDADKRIEIYNYTIESIKNSLTIANQNKDKLNKIINISVENNSKLNNINNQLSKYNLSSIEIEIKNLKNLKEFKLNEQSSYVILITEYKNKLEENEKQLNIYYKRKKYIDLVEHIVSEDGVKRFIINDLITILNDKIKTYLNITGAFYTCVFDNNFNAEFITATGPCTYENFSTGEKSRINICTLFAFKDMLVDLSGINSSIMVLDEFLDSGICQYGVEAIISIIKQLTSKNTQTVFLISHRGDINENNFDNIIELEKTNGFTKIYKDNQGEIKNANV